MNVHLGVAMFQGLLNLIPDDGVWHVDIRHFCAAQKSIGGNPIYILWYAVVLHIRSFSMGGFDLRTIFRNKKRRNTQSQGREDTCL